MHSAAYTFTIAFTLVGTASAQVFYATDGSTADNWRLDTATGVSAGPEWTGARATGLADDDAAQVYYIGYAAELRTASYGAPGGGTTLLGSTTYQGVSRSFTGLGAHNGVLYGTHNSGVEGLYAIDLVTLATTLVHTYSNQEIALEGMDFDPATALLWGANDGAAYTDPQGATGRGVMIVDVTQPIVTEALLYPYPVGENDYDGLAFDPAGRVYLIEDEPAPLANLDATTGAYDPSPPANASTIVGIYSAGTFTTGAPVGVGTNYCAAAVNSTGASARMAATGSAVAASNAVTLTASRLPNHAFGFFLTSRSQGFVQNPGGSQGNLCLSGAIGRFVGPGQIKNSGASGAIDLGLDLTRMPTPTGFVAVAPGDTWNFTAWYRDVAGGVATSNFADGLSVTFH